MPLTPEQKRAALLAEGSDPALFDIDDNTLETVPRVAQRVEQPNLSLTGQQSSSVSNIPPNSLQSQPQFGKLNTFGRTAASGVVPALAGAGAWAGAAAFAPETMGLSFLVPLAASIAAGWGTHKVQDALLNTTDTGKQFVADTTLASQQNPTSAVLGNLAATLPTMRPSIGMIKDATRGALAGNVGNAAMKNVALGTAMGTGAGIYEEYADPAPLNLTRLAANIGGGALMNKPADNKLARMVGIHPYVRPELYGRPEGMLPEVELTPSATSSRPVSTPLRSDALYTREPHIPQYKVNPDSVDASVASGKAKIDAMAKYKESEESLQPQLDRASGEGNVNNEVAEQQKVAKGIEAVKKGDIKYSQEGEQVPTTDESYAEFAGNTIGRERLLKSNQSLAKKVGAELEVLPKDVQTFESSGGLKRSVELPEEIKVSDRLYWTKNKDENAYRLKDREVEGADLGRWSLTYDDKNKVWRPTPYDGISIRKDLRGKNIYADSLKELNKHVDLASTGITHDVTGPVKSWERLGAKKENLGLSELGHETDPHAYVLKKPNGKQVYGEADISKGSAKITQTKPDTGFHEVAGHLLFENLPTKLQERYLKQLDKSNKFKPYAEWQAAEEAAGRTGGRREYLAQSTGEDDLRRITEKDSSLRHDLLSWFKVNVSRTAKAEDVVRQLSNRAYYGKGGEVTSKSSVVGESSIVNQESATPEYKEAPVTYKGYQEGSPSGKVKGFHLYDLTSDVSPTLVKGSTVSESQLNKEGYSGKHVEPVKNDVKNQDSEQQSTETKKEPDTDPSRKGFAKYLEASFDKVERVSKPLAQGFRNFASRKDQHLGLRNKALDALNKFKTDDVSRVVDAHDKFYRGETQSEPTFSGDDKVISDTLKDYFGKIADISREANLTIDGRERGKNPYYIPHQLNETALHTLINKAGSPEAYAIRNKMAQHISDKSNGSITLEAAKKDVTDYINALGGERSNYNSIKFGAIRKAAGYGLPVELRESDPFKSIDRYGRRAAADLALFQELESKPEFAAMLKIPDPRTGKIPEMPKVEGGQAEESMIHASPEVKEAMRWVMNNFVGSTENPKLTATVRLINNSLLGTATGLRDTASIINNTLPYVHNIEGSRNVIRSIGDFQKNWRKSLETGARQPNLDRAAFNDIAEAPDKVTKILQTVADGLRKWQGRELIENVNRTLTFGIGRQLGKGWIAGAKGGDAQSKKFLERFNTLVEGDVLKLEGDKLEAALDTIAKNFTDAHQGTYDGRGLPVGVMEGNFAPFVALQKWSIEKSNTIYKDVYKPFVDGSNRLPMLTYTLGSVLSGAAIQELNKVLTNRRGNEADVKEALWSKNPKHIAAEVATLMQLGSYLGIVGDAVKAASDIGLKGKLPRNIVSFPAATAIADLGEKLSDFSEAVQQGEDPLQSLGSFMLDIGKHNVQLLRMVQNRVDDEGAERSDMFRDVRVFKELTGEPIGDVGRANKYLNASSRKFKQTKDISEAAKELPNLMKTFADKVKENPERAMRFLKSLKANNYQTVPNPETSPIEFTQYYDFLSKTQGREAAVKRITDFVKQNAVNKAKSEMVP